MHNHGGWPQSDVPHSVGWLDDRRDARKLGVHSARNSCGYDGSSGMEHKHDSYSRKEGNSPSSMVTSKVCKDMDPTTSRKSQGDIRM